MNCCGCQSDPDGIVASVVSTATLAKINKQKETGRRSMARKTNGNQT
jgi:hypothetical protein